MKHGAYVIQRDPHTRPAAFREFSAQRAEQGLDLLLCYVGALWSFDNSPQCTPMFTLHASMIPKNGTTINYLIAVASHSAMDYTSTVTLRIRRITGAPRQQNDHRPVMPRMVASVCRRYLLAQDSLPAAAE